MYRQNLQKRMEEEQFLNRISSLPVIWSAITQASDIYNKTKESSQLMKYTLDTAESGVKCVASRAQPVVTKFDGQILKLNGYACTQLNHLEEKYPIITKPTDEVTNVMYEKTLKPAVDQVNAVTTYGRETAYNVKNYGIDKVNSVKLYGNEKASQLLNTSYGQAVSSTTLSTLSAILDVTETYMDYYLPEVDNEEKENVENTEKRGDSDTVGRALTVGGKMKRRLHRHAMRKLADVQKRSMETVNNLNFTVDLIQYAKDNLNSTLGTVDAGVARCRETVGTGVVVCRDKAWSVWEEINKSEEEVMQDDMNMETREQSLESRMIATARHLTLKLKRGFNALPNVNLLPEGIGAHVSSLRQYGDELYTTFSSAKTYEDLPHRLLTETKDRLSYVQETMTFITESALNSRALSWLAQKETYEESDSSDYKANGRNGDIEMESPVSNKNMNRIKHKIDTQTSSRIKMKLTACYL